MCISAYENSGQPHERYSTDIEAASIVQFQLKNVRRGSKQDQSNSRAWMQAAASMCINAACIADVRKGPVPSTTCARWLLRSFVVAPLKELHASITAGSNIKSGESKLHFRFCLRCREDKSPEKAAPSQCQCHGDIVVHALGKSTCAHGWLLETHRLGACCMMCKLICECGLCE